MGSLNPQTSQSQIGLLVDGENRNSNIILNSPPASPTWSRQISYSREQLRSLQEQDSPPRERRRSSQSRSQSPIHTPPLTRTPSPQSHDPFFVPAVEIRDQTPMPTQYRISQLHAQYNALPPLIPLNTRGRRAHREQLIVQNQPVNYQTVSNNTQAALVPQVQNLNQVQELPIVQVQQPVTDNRTTATRQSHQRGHARIENNRLFNIARSVIDTNTVMKHNMGSMNIICPYCNALHWLCERLSSSSMRRPKFGKCCLSGKISLPLHKEPPLELQRLYTERSPESKHFLSHIRNFNYAFAFTSLGVQNVSIRGNGPFCFKIKGRLHHRIGSFLPTDPAQSSFAQIYILNSRDDAIGQRVQNNPNLMQIDANLTREIMARLHDTIMIYNPLVQIYKSAFQLAINQSYITLRLCQDSGLDNRRYNLPSNSEIAILLPGSENVVAQHGQQWRDIILHTHAEVGDNNQVRFQRISEIHPLYLPLQYPLLFPFGDTHFKPNTICFQNREGNQLNNSNVNDNNDDDSSNESESQKYVTLRQFCSYMLHERIDRPNDAIFWSRDLMQELMVDNWAAIEQCRLNWISHNQKTIRGDSIQGLMDMQPNENLANIGQRIILPSNFQNGPRQTHQAYQDAMAISRFYKSLDLFITMTANPNWPEVKDALKPGQNASDRPDLVARVFSQKSEHLIHLIMKKGILGKAVAQVHTIEYQKRGLPHMHLLIILDENSKFHTPEDVDKAVSAELPDPTLDSELFTLVSSAMYHKCQNGKCIKDGETRCTKGFPKPYRDATTFTEDSYISYKRRNNKITWNGKVYDNSCIVPYNPYLLKTFNCHINVEICSSVKAVKYIYKYVYKGGDRAMLEQEENDEVKKYIDSRYISAHEAAWRIFSFKMHGEVPPVMRLAIHLENQQTILFDPHNETIDDVQSRAARKETTLTAFFKYNQQHADGRDILYQDFPQKYVYNKNKWKLRQKGFAIGRMYFVAPKEGERFYMRLLLTVQKGPTSFSDLRTVSGTIYPSYKGACLALGLLEDDVEWKQYLDDAIVYQLPKQLRNLFALILSECHPADPQVLWDTYKNSLCDGLLYELQHSALSLPSTLNQVLAEDYGLFLLEEKILMSTGNTLDKFHMSRPIHPWSLIVGNRLIAAQRYSGTAAIELAQKADTNYLQMNTEQKYAFNTICNAVQTNQGGVFFLNGPAGTGKTFCYNTICYHIRGQGKIVLCVASSGIAALLLQSKLLVFF